MTCTQGPACATTSAGWPSHGSRYGTSWPSPASTSPASALVHTEATSRRPSSGRSRRPSAAATRGTAPMLSPTPSTSSTLVVLTPTPTAASGTFPM